MTFPMWSRTNEDNDEALKAILDALPAGVREIWLEPRRRAAAIGDIVAAIDHPHRRNDLGRAVQEVDDAVSMGLAALGLPRAALRGPVEVLPRALGRNGIKLPDCRLTISATYVRTLGRLYGTVDPAFRTWVHESLHARQPYAPDFLEEFVPYEGYEEGLADGLSGLICGTWARMTILDTDYAAYVRAYTALASLLDLSTWALWRALWAFPVGRVRQGLVQVVGVRWQELTGGTLVPSQTRTLLEAGDRLFASGRIRDDLSDSTLQAQWQSILR